MVTLLWRPCYMHGLHSHLFSSLDLPVCFLHPHQCTLPFHSHPRVLAHHCIRRHSRVLLTWLYLNRSKAKILTEFHTFVFCFAVQFLEMQAVHKAKQVEFWKDFRESEFTPSLSPGKASASFRAQSHVYPILSLLLTSHSPFNDLRSGFDFHHSWWTVSKLSLSVSLRWVTKGHISVLMLAFVT